MLSAQDGISLIGVLIVLLLAGLALAGLAPKLLSRHVRSVAETDYQALETAKTAMISHAFSMGWFPAPLAMDANGMLAMPVAAASGVGGLMPPSAGSGAVPALGVNNWGMFGKENPFRMDVNDNLKQAAVVAEDAIDKRGYKNALCELAVSEMTATTPQPRICLDTAGIHDSVAAACAETSRAAFVIYSTGTNRIADQENGLANTAGAAYRSYEHDNRGMDNSAGASHYDDQLVSYPLAKLVEDCTRMGLLSVPTSPPEPPPSCIGKELEVVNSSNNAGSYKTTGNPLPSDDIACTKIEKNQISLSGCQDSGATVTVYNSPACTGGGSSVKSFNVGAADINNDGETLITILQPAATSVSQ